MYHVNAGDLPGNEVSRTFEGGRRAPRPAPPARRRAALYPHAGRVVRLVLGELLGCACWPSPGSATACSFAYHPFRTTTLPPAQHILQKRHAAADAAREA